LWLCKPIPDIVPGSVINAYPVVHIERHQLRNAVIHSHELADIHCEPDAALFRYTEFESDAYSEPHRIGIC